MGLKILPSIDPVFSKKVIAGHVRYDRYYMAFFPFCDSHSSLDIEKAVYYDDIEGGTYIVLALGLRLIF